MGDYCIPFNRACSVGTERGYMLDAVATAHISGDGPYSLRCSRLLEGLLGSPKVLLTPSCTHSLEAAALLLDIVPGDEVVVPSFTFASTANAFALRGARVVFCDVRPDTLNMDERQLARLVGPRTRAIVPVHYAGVGCEMDAILEVAGSRGIAVVEDAAHGLFGRWRGRPLGSFGRLAALSFHETKNVTCGEGGALVVNDPALIERAEVVRQKGTDRSRFFRGQVDRYTWVDLGSSWLLSDMLAAFLFGQLEAWDRIQAARRRVWQFYAEKLGPVAERYGLGLPRVPAHADLPWHLFYLLLPSLERRQSLIAHLAGRGIQAVFHYVPLHLSAMGRAFGALPGDCPVAEDVSDRLLRLPFYADLTEHELGRVVGAVVEFLERGSGPDG